MCKYTGNTRLAEKQINYNILNLHLNLELLQQCNVNEEIIIRLMNQVTRASDIC